MKNIFLLTALSFSIIVAKGQKADRILYNGNIFTSDEKSLFVEAIAIKGNKIMAAGSNKAIEELTGEKTQKINLLGKTVIPGINDAHFHLDGGFKAATIQFNSMDPAWNDLIDSIRKISARLQKDEWIQATIGPSIANLAAANRFALDSVTATHPVRLMSYWGHVGIYNTLGLKLLGISTTQANPPGGRYERMPDGKTLTGKCFEHNAYDPESSYNIFSSLRDENGFVGYLKGISQAFLQLGVTSVQNMCSGEHPADYISFLKKTGLHFRLRLIRWGNLSATGEILVPDTQLPLHDRDLPLVTVFGTKWLLDGTPIEGGAAVTEGYSYDAKHFGYLNYSASDIEGFLRDALKRNDQICFHAVGDSTVNTLLATMEKINIDWKHRRVRIEHADGLLPGQFERAKNLGIIVVQNPLHFMKDVGGNFRGNMTKYDFRFQSLLKAGIPVAIGSDGPFNPFLNILFAVTDPIHPDEAMTVEQAVIAYTKTAAYAEFEEKEKGTLTAGELADLAILSQDIFTIPVQQLPNTRSVMTIVDGKIVYKE